eukprot:TRINITY_DN2956_c0_g4_i1.p1 TRINITY_DN2956_c0_g4~~TRINITY_DN2956_c0_g4_i1.p1  ORF type:complete len:230 (-),score=34.31 TRINITY_DN2956_c0_g4_i1:170-859(-)
MKSSLDNLSDNELLCANLQPDQIAPLSLESSSTNIASLLLLSPSSFNIKCNLITNESKPQYNQIKTSNSLESIPTQSFDLENKQNRSIESGKKQNKQQLENSIHRWNKQECLLYDKFISMYLDVILEKGNDNASKIQIKRNKNLFQMMSRFIGTRNVTQCRSHHQKFFRKALQKLGINQDEQQFPQEIQKQSENIAEVKPVKKVKLNQNNQKKIKSIESNSNATYFLTQ